jgi:hypothetical protein
LIVSKSGFIQFAGRIENTGEMTSGGYPGCFLSRRLDR